MTTFSEKLFLITIDPVTGRFFPIPDHVLNLTLAGALLFDASFSGSINDDCEQLSVINSAETGNSALDEALRCIQFCEKSVPLDKALAIVASHGSTLRQMIRQSLQNRGSVIRKKKELVFYSQKNELFTLDFPLVIDIHKKIRNAIIQDKIPDFQVPALISLIVAGGLLKYILKPDESIIYQEKIQWLARMESLGREMIQAIQKMDSANLESDVALMIGLKHEEPKSFAGGVDSVLTSLSYLYKEAGMSRSRKIIAAFNQVGGFECPGCAWPNPDHHRSNFEFCESGAKNVSAEATIHLVTADFFKKWSVQDLRLTSGIWLEQQGRLSQPMLLKEHANHYIPITWSEAFQVIADELNSLKSPDEAVFYASGRTSNEAAFLYQLFARTFGTNNLSSSANLCHEPSGKALNLSLGYGKSSVALEDFPIADAIFVFGHNPGSNHPRMLNSLKEASRKGCRIVAVNPMPEASLMGFADPQEIGSYFGKQTALAHLYIQPTINGDMALIRGIIKAVLESEEANGGVLDKGFISAYTSGFDVYQKFVLDTPWDVLVSMSGVPKSQMTEAANIYLNANKVIASWCLGITHHQNSIETIQEIINLLLLRGNIGKPGAGVCPVRGHSNIQGVRSMGVGENMPVTFLESLEDYFSVSIPKKTGLSTIPTFRAMADGKVKILISLGGNLASAVPDTLYVENALQKCQLTVMISTKLNRSHVISGKKALILPCLSRSEEDISSGTCQMVSIEDAMGRIGFSKGCLPQSSTNQMSEIAIVARMAEATLGDTVKINWQRYSQNYHFIRETISETIPAFKALEKNPPNKQGFYLENPLRTRVFKTIDHKAHFANNPLDSIKPGADELILMTIRSHDQFNTSIFGLNDRYRGITNERRVLFMNPKDMDARQIAPEQMVDIQSRYDGTARRLEGYYAIPYPIRNGCVAAYFPEANVLLSINNTSSCETPAYKSVKVTVTTS